MKEDPCQCWRGPVWLHNGHCCFTPENSAAKCHQREGMTLAYPGIRLGPDCQDGKHPCAGDALDELADQIVPCGCNCHDREAS